MERAEIAKINIMDASLFFCDDDWILEVDADLEAMNDLVGDFGAGVG